MLSSRTTQDEKTKDPGKRKTGNTDRSTGPAHGFIVDKLTYPARNATSLNEV
jgi:hypothetical protein